MKDRIKSLLIHNDTANSKVTAVVTDDKSLAQKAQEFFRQIPKKGSQQCIVLRAEGNESNYAVACEKENFIIVSKKGSTKSARLYGNWNEALNFAREIIAKHRDANKNLKFILAEYKNK